MKSASRAILWVSLLGCLLTLYSPIWAATAEQDRLQVIDEWNQGLQKLTGQLEKLNASLISQGQKDAQANCQRRLDEIWVKQKGLAQDITVELNRWADWAGQLSRDENLNEAAAARLRDYRPDFETNVRQLDTALSQMKTALAQPLMHRQLEAITQAKRWLSRLQVSQHKPLDVANLPVQAVNLSPRNLSPKLDQLPVKPSAEDLQIAEPLSENIENLVSQLENDPVKIYQWVKDNITYLPFYGSLKSAERCFRDRQGTDFDQAWLLVTMLRAARIPARLVYGRQGLTLAERPAWLGVKDIIQAGELLSQGGIPYRDNNIDRVWVKAYLDHNNVIPECSYRGLEAILFRCRRPRWKIKD